MYKIISIDLDDTLLDESKQISEENFESIKQAKENGYIICVNTGRNYISCIDICEDIDADYVIYLNGCFIRNVKTGKFIRNRVISFFHYLLYNLFPFYFIANKYYGLRLLCFKLFIRLKHCVAIGDNISDLRCIKKVGLGISVANGEWALKYSSDYITLKDNNNSAVADAIYYVLAKDSIEKQL